jgi:carbonic anhydrase
MFYYGPVADWDYSEGPNGPAHWGELSRDWKKCSSGSHQSPIDIADSNIHLDGLVDAPAKIYYQDALASVRADGKTLEVSFYWPYTTPICALEQEFLNFL